MSADGSPFLFVRDAAEIASLRQICRSWQSGPERFWSFDAVLAAVARRSSLVYFAAPERTAHWQGVIFADVGLFSADLLYLHVIAAHRRSGIARRLVGKLLEELSRRSQIESLFLEVRASNKAAQLLYEGFSMSCISRRKGYYSDGEDALVYSKSLRGKGES